MDTTLFENMEWPFTLLAAADPSRLAAWTSLAVLNRYDSPSISELCASATAPGTSNREAIETHCFSQPIPKPGHWRGAGKLRLPGIDASELAAQECEHGVPDVEL